MSAHLVVGLEVVYVFIEGQHPELFADEDDSVQLVLEARSVSRRSLYQALPHAMSQAFQPLQYLSLFVSEYRGDAKGALY